MKILIFKHYFCVAGVECRKLHEKKQAKAQELQEKLLAEKEENDCSCSLTRWVVLGGVDGETCLEKMVDYHRNFA